MIELTKIERKILDLIPEGINRKISIREISKLINLNHRRIYEIINHLRKKGVPICAIKQGKVKDRGYFIAMNERERALGLHHYNSQIIDMQRTVAHVEQANLHEWREYIN